MIVSCLQKIIENTGFDEKMKSFIIGGYHDTGIKSSTVKLKVSMRNAQPNPRKNNTAVVMLYFIGGLTYTEISAVRLLGEKLNVQFIFCTDSIINSEDFITQLLPDS